MRYVIRLVAFTCVRQPRALPICSEAYLAERRDCEVAGTPGRHALIEGMVDPPSSARRVQHQDLRSLKAFRSWPVHPIAVAGEELAPVIREDAHFRSTHEMSAIVPASGYEGELGGELFELLGCKNHPRTAAISRAKARTPKCRMFFPSALSAESAVCAALLVNSMAAF
jgi:hypothetical protein